MRSIRVVGDVRKAFAVEVGVEDDVDIAQIDTDAEEFQARVADAIGGNLKLCREHALDISEIELVT